MTTTYYVDGTAGSDTTGDGSSGNPYQTIAKCANGSGSFVNDDILIYCAAGTTITANTPTSSPFSTVSGRNLTLRAYGGGARPEITCSNRGFRCLGAGSMDFQDVNITGGSAGTAAESLTGGGMSLVNTELRGFAVTVRCGSGVIYANNMTIDKPSQNGLKVDANFDQPIATSIQILNSTFIAASPTQQDLLVLHDGGIGLLTGAIIDGCRLEALGTAYIESGIDIQQQFKGTIVRNNTVIGASQWGLVMGSLWKGSTTSFSTKAAMLAYFSREGQVGAPVLPGNANVIHGGHCARVTADGGNNGFYQLIGNNPSQAAAWDGPLSAGDFSANPNLIYCNKFIDNVAGVQVQHPGSQIVANVFLGTTLGNWSGADVASGAGNILSLYDMGYDALVMDNVFASSVGKYTEIGNDGNPTGNLLTSTRAAINIKALRSGIAQRSRAVFTGNVVRLRAEHEGPFVEFVNAADKTYFDSDYNAFIADVGVSDGTWPEFCDDDGTARTFSSYKTANSSDSHSFFQTPTTAKIDADCRPEDSSTLIAAGVARAGLDVSIPATDSEGNAISSPPDIGGYRYLSEVVAATLVPTPRRHLRAARSTSEPPVSLDPPDAVTGFTNTGSTAVSLYFSWDESARAASYELRHSISGSGTWESSTNTTIDTVGEVTGLDPAYSWDVQIRAINAIGSSDWSATVTASTPNAVWYKPQVNGSKIGGAGLPEMTERYFETGATTNPGAYVDSDVYTLLTDNGGTGGGVALVAIDDNTARRIDGVLSLVGMASGNQKVIAFEASHEQDGTQSFYWDYGCHSSISSMYALHVTASSSMTFTSRGVGASVSTNTELTHDSGPTYEDYNGEGLYRIFVSIRSVSTLAVDVEVRIVHPTVGTSIWTGSAINCSFNNDIATLPGITSGQTSTEHGGLMLAARMRSLHISSGIPEKALGIGTGHVATIGVFQARAFSTYDASRLDDAINHAVDDPDGWWLS